ncbi:MAG: asparagine synthase (glutamine-hydrolyzing) [Ferruginibacter sp.]|nr:asparagine synthase (glutamine-hydrolyzing) [Ferruginibacter sp.]
MCGIAGYISLNNIINEQQLKQAAFLMKHRGPDADGYYFSDDKTVGLAHRRLSILDLSASANQPMFSADGRYCIVFNGEVYNFKELRQQLSDKGALLKTTSDTEVILQLFAEQGNACFTSMNGMFAMAIYDTVKQIITLSRDHIGIKPLFYYCDDTEFIFSSELKVIRYIKEKQLAINKKAIPYFLHLGYIPQPLTIYQNVFKFPSASYCEISIRHGSFINTPETVQTFWRPEDQITAAPLKDERIAKKKLKALLTDAVEKQLISDVPIGTFLSGGVDSSLITAISAELTAHKVKTFSIAIDDGKYNESKYARAVAKELNTEHHEFQVKGKELIELVDKLLPAYDEPYGDPSAFPTMMVSKLARQSVSVTISGDGGDELFMGYGAYRWALRLNNPAMALIKKPLHIVSGLLNDRIERAGQMFNFPDRHNIHSHIFSTEQYYFGERELSVLLTTPSFNFYELNDIDVAGRKLNAAESQSLWDLKSYLKDELLVKVDRASMQYSLETRVPILDYRIVTFALNLHPSLKINEKGTMKYLLKEVLYDYLPRELFERPKWGFSIPISKWMRSDLFYLLDKYTSKEMIEKYNYVNFERVAAIKKAWIGGKDYLYGRLWLLMVLHWWLDENQL